MALSTDLISQFVKATNDKEEVKKESTVYGTTVEHDGTTYVKLDGSDLLTPITTTADTKPGERVTVMIKNHTATVTGNISSPAARSGDIKDIAEAAKKISDFEIVIADKVSTEALNAEKARIDALVADNVTIKQTLTAAEGDIDKLQASSLNVTEKLTAAEANITKLQTEKISTIAADAKYATIENLEATNADLNNLESTYGDFTVLATNKFNAIDASIAELYAQHINVVDLEAAEADIVDLEAEVADINTLIFGSSTGNVIQTSFANAVIAQLGDAQIKSAMIKDVSADKIKSGDIITNNVRVLSEDGKLLISDETIQISDDTRARVQIGKDASGDYSINIWDAEGKLMFSKGGITDNAIKEAIIRNDMVSDTANIAAHKLDIDSLFEEINGSEKTIKSTKIYLDDKSQTLDVAFKSVTTDLEELQNGVSSQGTQITAIQGQIASKIWKNDIETAVNEVGAETENLSTQYEELQQDVTSMTATVANHTSEIAKKADNTTVTEVNNKVTSLETNLSGFQTTVSETYATKTELGAVNLVNDQLPGLASEGTWENVGDGWLRCTYDNSEGTTTVYGSYRFAFSDYVSHLAANTPLTMMSEMRDLGSTDGVYAYSYPENDDGVNRIQVKGSTYVYAVNARDKVTVSRTITAYVMPESTSGLPKTALGGWLVAVPAGGTADVLVRQGIYEGEYRGKYVAPVGDVRSLDNRIKTAETTITQNNESITSLASRTETVENKFDDYSTTAEMNSAIDQKANSITSTVSSTYSTKNETTAAINAIEVGGRNLLLNSETELIVDRNYAHSLAPVELHNDDIFTYSVWLKASEDTTVSVYINDDTGQTRISLYFTYGLAVTTEYQHFVFTGRRPNTMSSASVIPDKNIRMRVYAPEGITLTGKLAKLELGNKATDWTPAPEDMATSHELATVQSSTDLVEERVTTAETIIEQLSDCISMMVTDGNGESLMTQTTNGWTFSTKEIQDIVDATSENLDTLTNEVGDIDSAVGILQQAVSDLGVLSEYIKITTYEDEPCIELGETDSDFKLLITNTRIMFMEGTGVPAYLNNQSLFINKAVVEEELQQGEFVWKVRSNGNLGLIWKGASS